MPRPAGGSIFVEGSPERIQQILRFRRLGRVVACGFLRGDLDVSIGRNELVRKGHTLHDIDALTDQRIVFHVAHGYEPIDTPQTEPVDHVGHELLEPRVLDAGDAFRALEIRRCGIAPGLPLARIVDQELGDLAERTSFLAIVDDDPEPAGLSPARAFLDAVNQIGTTGADIGTENVWPVAFVMYPAGEQRAGIIE